MTDVIDAANRWLAKIAAYCALAMLLAQVFSVFARYVFSYGLISVQETVVYGHAIMFLLGAAFVLQVNAHVRVDVFYALYSPRTRKIVDLIGLACFVLPITILIGWYAFPYIARSWSTLEGSRQSGGLPAVFLLKSAILVFAVSMSLQAISCILRILRGEAWEER